MQSSLLLANFGPDFDITHVFLVVVAAIFGWLFYDFIRQSKGRSSISTILTVIIHVLFISFLSVFVQRCLLSAPTTWS